MKRILYLSIIISSLSFSGAAAQNDTKLLKIYGNSKHQGTQRPYSEREFLR